MEKTTKKMMSRNGGMKRKRITEGREKKKV